MAKFKPGQSGNPTGRPKGAKSKTTGEFRELLAEGLADHIEMIPTYIDALDNPKEKLDLLAKFMPYILPRLQSTELREVTTLDELFQMTPDERQARIIEIQKKLSNESA